MADQANPAGGPGPGAPGSVLGKRAFEGEEAQANKKTGQSETVFRLLVASRKVGAVLGKAGSIVKQIRDDTGARIRVVEPVPGCDERVIVISSKNDHQDQNPSQKALFQVHKRVIEGEEPAAPVAHGAPAGITSRLLVCHSQAGSLIGKGGKIIKDMRESTGAHIKILPAEELPVCGLSNDRIVQLVGTPDQLQQALQLVSNQIRDNPPKERPGGVPQTLNLQALANTPPAPGSTNPWLGAQQGPPPAGRF